MPPRGYAEARTFLLYTKNFGALPSFSFCFSFAKRTEFCYFKIGPCKKRKLAAVHSAFKRPRQEEETKRGQPGPSSARRAGSCRARPDQRRRYRNAGRLLKDGKTGKAGQRAVILLCRDASAGSSGHRIEHRDTGTAKVWIIAQKWANSREKGPTLRIIIVICNDRA